jgi:flagellar M-ring protein FliF
MREKFAEALEHFKVFWQSLRRWQQISMVAAGVLVLGGILSAAVISNRTGYDILFAGLEARDQDVVITYLEDEGIPYRIDSAANAILVPADSKGKTRIALEGKGMLTGGINGYELLDKNKVGKTTFEEKTSYKRALEGELSRTIGTISSVASARVTIVVPEPRLFLESREPSTAAVLLKLRPGAGTVFGQEQARAIINLVSHSVEGLLSENVALVDADGVISFEELLDDTLGVQIGSNRDLRQRNFERSLEAELQKKIKDSLEKPFGRGKVVATVKAELDFDKRQATNRVVSPLPEKLHGVVQSDQNVEESYTGPPGQLGGVPGTTTNIPGYDIATGQTGGAAQYDRSETIRNYDNSTRESQEIESQGKIKRLTATVLIDRDRLSRADLDRWHDAVINAIGADEARGDRLSVIAVPFDHTEEDALKARLAEERKNRMILGISSFAILLLAVVGGFLLWLRRRRQLEALEAARRAAEVAETPSLRELLENPDLMTSQGELSVLEEQLRNYAMNNPEEMANLIKNWVVDDV